MGPATTHIAGNFSSCFWGHVQQEESVLVFIDARHHSSSFLSFTDMTVKTQEEKAL